MIAGDPDPIAGAPTVGTQAIQTGDRIGDIVRLKALPTIVW